MTSPNQDPQGNPDVDIFLQAFLAERYESSADTPRPSGPDEWRAEATYLIGVRDAFRRKYTDPDALNSRADYGFLRGQLSTALRELSAYEIAKLQLSLELDDI